MSRRQFQFVVFDECGLYQAPGENQILMAMEMERVPRIFVTPPFHATSHEGRRSFS